MHSTAATTGLALGGGAALGAAHVGVLKAIEEYDIQINAISGTSVGAMIAAMYAFGMKPDEIEERVTDLQWLDVSTLSLSRMGLLSNDELGELFLDTFGEVDIKDAEIPLTIVATDLTNGEKVVFREGDLAAAVKASTCIPGIFIPVEMDGRMLADGGLVENVPVDSLKETEELSGRKLDRIVAVDINALRLYQKPDDIIEVVLNALDIAIETLSKATEDQVDILIRPELSSYSRTVDEPEKLRELIEKGYQSARQQLGKGSI